MILKKLKIKLRSLKKIMKDLVLVQEAGKKGGIMKKGIEKGKEIDKEIDKGTETGITKRGKRDLRKGSRRKKKKKREKRETTLL